MIPSAMRLDSCVVTSLTVQCRPGTDGADEADVTVDQRMQFGVERHPSSPRFRFVVEFGIDWPEDARTRFQRVAIGLTAEFSFPEEAPQEMIDVFVPEVCLANLYATARGLVAQATAMCPGGPFLLPLVNIREILKTAEPAESAPEGEDDGAEAVPVAPPAKQPKRRKVKEAS